MTKQVALEVLLSATVNFAMQQNHVQPVHRIRLKNVSGRDIRGLSLSVEADPAFVMPYEVDIPLLRSREKREITPVLTPCPSLLFSLTEQVRGSLTVTLRRGEEVLEAYHHEISVLAYDQWQGFHTMPELTAAFVTPNHPYIAEIVKRAGARLRRMERGAMFDGYSSGSSIAVLRQVQAIYAALCEEGLAYQLPPPGFVAGQRLRLADTVSETRTGTCFDLTLLFAGCLEYVRLHPLIVLTDSHALVGCWLGDRTFPDCIQDDLSALRRRTHEDLSEICLIETTAITRGKPFSVACEEGEGRLDDAGRFRFAVDVRRTRLSGISPIPLRRYDKKGNLLSPDAPQKEGRRARKLYDGGDASSPAGVGYTKQQLWERKLLDLSQKNALLNYRATKRSLQLLTHSMSCLEAALRTGGEFTLLPRPKEIGEVEKAAGGILMPPKKMPEKLLSCELEGGKIRTYLEEDTLTEALTGLWRSSRNSLQECGANPLYLALGFLRWYETERSVKPLYAPLILVPVELVRHSAPRAYTLRVREEEVRFNITLLEMLRTVYDIEIPGLDPLPRTEEGVDIRRAFHLLRRALVHLRRFEVVEGATVANFSFSRFIMWNDLHNRAQEIESNRTVSALIEGKADPAQSTSFLSPGELDERVFPADVAAPLPYDSSQLSAIVAAGEGQSFVLHGPPGTGKSQTITNMICNALYGGKTVLFIAEKMAALSVVESRLAALGLSPFCLELHSDKAKKTDVLAHLGETLENAHAASPKGHGEDAARILALRRTLNQTLSLVHRDHSCGFSLYDAIVLYEQYRDAPAVEFFTPSHFENLTPALRQAWEDLIREYIALANACGGARDNPLSIYRKDGYSHGDKARLATALEEYHAAAAALKKAYDAIRALLPLREEKTYLQMGAIATLCSRLADTTVLPKGLLLAEGLAETREQMERLCKTGKRHVQLREVLLFRFDADLLRQSPEEPLSELHGAQKASFFVRQARLRAEKKRLAVHAKDPASLSVRELESVWHMVEEYQSTAETIRDLLPVGKRLFGELCRAEGSDFGYLERLWRDAYDLYTLVHPCAENNGEMTALLRRLDDLASRGELHKHSSLFRTFAASYEALSQLEGRIADLCETDTAEWHSARNWLCEEGDLFDRARERVQSLRDWCSYRAKREEMHSAGLGALASALEEGTLGTADLLPAFYRATALAVANALVEGDSSLTSFSGAMMEEKIKEYRTGCDRFASLTVEELKARICARIPISGDPAASSELGILTRAIRSGGRGMSLRQIFDAIPHLLRRLCPCMLMSPLSVAQYLDPSQPLFDLVIFDEASQMPTCEAVGAIARGKSLIVVGDPNQLPPTSFFTATHFDEDNCDKEDLDSLLDDCLALSMPQLHLLWHYRSRHESLIAFSNRRYYDNRLNTFPSPSAPLSRVRLISVDGIYDRGRTRQNRVEAEAVVSEIIRRLTDPETAGQSIGVVTFSSVQQLLIEDLLEARLARNEAAEEALARQTEPIFVKNLENVQGDERDVILFSVCYGPDRTGRLSMNFGPLGRAGGWRRLNVAVSRAREEMLVFSSIQPEQIDLRRTEAQGIAGLRAFLEYARDGMDALTTHASYEGAEYGLGDCLAEMLRTKGYEADTHIGASSCQIDVAVKDPYHEGEYLLGILCDSTKDTGGTSARDRNIQQERVLFALGWRLHHLWSVDFWDAPDREFDKIVKLLTSLKRASRKRAQEETKKQGPTEAPTEQTPAKRHRSGYERCIYTECAPVSPSKSKQTAQAFLSPDNRKMIDAQLTELLAAEAPISYETLRRRILGAWGLRPTPKLDTHLTSLLSEKRCVSVPDGESVFYWLPSQVPEEWRLLRLPSSPERRRAPADIPREEIAVALATVVDEQLSLSREDAFLAVGRLLGYSRPTAKLTPRLEAGLACAIARRLVLAEGNRLISPHAT